jgi:hypothetical protein
MNPKSESLPQLRTTTRRVLTDLNSKPDFGKGIIYKVEWGFRLDKSSSYGGRGQYIGLTVNSVNDRLRQHIKSASSLGYDGEVVTGSQKTDDSNKSPRMFYLALRVAMGLTNDTNIEFNKDYRTIKAIKHVNLFDLAYEEINQINGNVSETSYSRYSDYVRSGIVRGSSANSPAPFNETPGGEGNKINTGRASAKELVMAALLFMKEGRGSTEPMRSTVGIGKQKKDKDGNIIRNTIAEDVRAVFTYFKKAPGYEGLRGRAPDASIPKILSELGVGELKGEDLVVSSDKTKMINILLRFGLTEAMDLDKVQARALVQNALLPNGLTPSMLNIKITSVNEESAKELMIAIKKSGILKSLGKISGLFKLSYRLKKIDKNYQGILNSEIYKLALLDFDGALAILFRDPKFKKAYEADQNGKKKERMERKRNRQR